MPKLVPSLLALAFKPESGLIPPFFAYVAQTHHKAGFASLGFGQFKLYWPRLSSPRLGSVLYKVGLGSGLHNLGLGLEFGPLNNKLILSAMGIGLCRALLKSGPRLPLR